MSAEGQRGQGITPAPTAKINLGGGGCLPGGNFLLDIDSFMIVSVKHTHALLNGPCMLGKRMFGL